MLDALFPLPASDAPPCSASMEEALSLYVDGELALEAQPALFTHLSSCVSCRKTLAAVLEFRRLSRREAVAVPPAVDDAIMGRLAQRKATRERIDRVAERRPLWQARMPVSFRAAVAAVLFVFVAGLLIPTNVEPAAVVPAAGVQGEEERVRFPERIPVAEAVYVIYPGLTVEAYKAIQHEEISSVEPL